MKLLTKYFGEVDYSIDSTLHFASGIFGFDEEKEFVLLPFEQGDGMLLCMQSTATPALAFVLMNPFALDPSYAPVLQPQELEDLGVKDSKDLCYYVLCTAKKPVSESTINMKCPIVINDETYRAAQVILEGDAYEMRKRLSDFERKADDVSC